MPDLNKALEQAQDYAERIDAPIIFASNGLSFKSHNLEIDKPLFLNGAEIDSPIPSKLLVKFFAEKTNVIYTVSKEVIKNRGELITVFSELNDDLRALGIRAGIERFTEFSNLLFLKLLSEKDSNEIWNELIRARNVDIINYLNEVAMPNLRQQYGGEVISKSVINNADTLKKIVNTLNPLRLSDIDEDIKGVAFEHFIQKTTAQNDLGEYYTPRHIVRFMVRLLNPKFGKSVYDPFCGTGGFLIEAFKHISQQKSYSKNAHDILCKKTVFGQEITTTARIAKMNMILYGDGHSGVENCNSLEKSSPAKYDNVLSNIPFSQKVDQSILDNVGYFVRDADQACVMRCFDSLKLGGSMAIIVPQGFLVNNAHTEFIRYLLQHSRVKFIIKLPQGCFAPYTASKTGVIYLTRKGVEKTEWFYRVSVKNDGFDSSRNPVMGINDLDQILYFNAENLSLSAKLPNNLDIGIVRVENLQSEHSFYLHEDWKKSKKGKYIKLKEIASINNGISITERKTVKGDVPVIAGGGGSVPYYHNKSNYQGGVFTLSKTGAYSGYVWWHDQPIWASDSIAVQSKNESNYLTRYLYFCMKSKQDEIYSRQQGTGQPHIYTKHINDFPIPMLPIAQQTDQIEKYMGKLKELKVELKNVTDEISLHEDEFYQVIRSKYDCSED